MAARGTAGGRSARSRLPLLVFLLGPAVVLCGLVIVFPALSSINSSAHAPDGSLGTSNFQAIFDDPVFWQAFKNNVLLLVSIPVRIVMALFLTALLLRGVFGRRIYETALFLPFVPSIAAVGVIFIYLLNADGPVNGFLHTIGLGFLAQGWLTDSSYAMWSIMGVIVWTRVGFTILLFMARLLSVDREQFQAAFVDGASWTRVFRDIALPQLRGTIEFVAVLSVIEVFSWSFAYVYVLSQGANNTKNYILEIYLYNQEFLASLPGLAAATAVVLMVVVSVLAIYRYRKLEVGAVR